MGENRAMRRTAAPMRASWALAVLLCAYPLLPQGPVRSVAYDVFGLLCIGVGLWGLSAIRTPARRGLLLVLLGFAGWVLGDIVFSVEQGVFHVGFYPVPSDAVYLSSYVLLGLGLLRLVRGRRTGRDLAPLLDSAILATGFGIVVITFFIAPIAADSGLSLAGRIVSGAYPVADVLLLGVLVRLWASVAASTPAFRLLLLSLVATLAADTVWNVVALNDAAADTTAWLDMLWLLGYLAAGMAASRRSAALLGDGASPSALAAIPRRRLVMLGCGSVLPGLTLLADGVARDHVPWRIVSIGSILLSVLVIVRVALLLRTVEVQAVQLSALAGNDPVTGAPNRRTWDHELGRALHTARAAGTPLCVAMVDLDRFKPYNDQHGHQAGDRLLRESVAAWTSVLRPGELLARYGGDEFGLILPGLDAEEAAVRLREMQAVTPSGQQFSGGVASGHPDYDPTRVVGLADRALYDAKHAGRSCIRIAPHAFGVWAMPPLRIALQPIVDLMTGAPVGAEALSRFEEDNPEAVFERAHRDGYGADLEAAAIAAALRRRTDAGYLSINVSIGSLTSPQVRDVLPDDLHGVVVEITEQTDTGDWDGVDRFVEELRGRGAATAIDDWGRGYSNVERQLRLRPEVVKLDRGFLDGLGGADHQFTIQALATWAHQLGAKVCAEGIETEEQWYTLRDLGIDLGQGYFFGRPQLEAAAAQVPVLDAR